MVERDSRVELWQSYHGHDLWQSAAEDIADLERAGLLVLDPVALVERIARTIDDSFDTKEPWSVDDCARAVLAALGDPS